jgi:hypothetical protein
MGTEANPAVSVAHFQIRVMILPVGYPGNRIYESHGLVKILKLKIPADLQPVIRQVPAVIQLRH